MSEGVKWPDGVNQLEQEERAAEPPSRGGFLFS